MHQSIFVTGATGTQGGYVARELLRAGHTVHTIARNPDSASAQALKQAGAKVFPGNFDSVDSMVAAAQRCTCAFINVSPVFTDPQGEAKHGQNVVDACRKAGITRIVQSSVPSLERLERGELRGMSPENPTLKYRYSKISKLAGAQLTFPEIINIMNEVLGDDRVRLEQISEAEAKELRKTNLIVGSEVFLNENPEMIVVNDMYDFGFKTHSAKEYFTREKAILDSSVSAA